MKNTTATPNTDKHHELVSKWIADGCNPTSIPAFLKEEGLKLGNYNVQTLLKEVNRQAEIEAEKFVSENVLLQEFLTDLRQGKLIFEGWPYDEGYVYINTSRLVFSDDVQANLLNKFSLIKEDARILAGAVLLMEKNFPFLWTYNPGGRYESIYRRYLMCGWENFSCANERYAKFYLRLNPKIEHVGGSNRMHIVSIKSSFYDDCDEKQRRYTYCYDLYELGKQLKEEKQFKRFDRIENFLFDEIVYLAYGLERTANLMRNFWKSISIINTGSEIGYGDRVLDKFCHGNWSLGQKISTIKLFVDRILAKDNVTTLLRYDADAEHGLIAYLDGRSVYGGSGGVGQIRQVILLCGQEQAMQEFTYRDRYSSSNDNYAVEFHDVKFGRIKADGKFLNVQIIATPAESRYPARLLSFRIKADDRPAPIELSLNEQKRFLEEFEEQKRAKMKEFLESASHQTGEVLNKDYSGYSPYPQPNFSTPEAINPALGLAAFVIRECIDNSVTSLQWRYRLFLARLNQPLLEIYEDHAYENEGDVAICGLSLIGKKLLYNCRSGQRTYDC